MTHDASSPATGAAARAVGLSRPVATGAVLLGYLGLRAVNAIEVALASRFQTASGPANPLGQPSEYFVHTATPAAPGLTAVLTNWDGQWYERIAVDGYPTGGQVRSPNDAWAWAFPPLFPLLARAVMALTGLGFAWSAMALNLILGAVATLLVFLLFRPAVGDRLAVVAALLLGAFPSAPLFMLAFSEPLALVLLLGTLLTTVAHRHWWSIPLVLALALTRPVAAPLALVLALHWLLHRKEPFSCRGSSSKLALGVGVVTALASPFLWGLLSAMVLRATDTSSVVGAERTSSIIKRFDFGWLGAIERSAGVPTLLLFLAITGGLLGYASVAAVRCKLAPELVTWGVAYVAFVLLVTPLHTAFIRYLLLATPLLLALPVRALAQRRALGIAALVGVVGASLWLQWLWIRYVYVLDPAPALLPFAA